MAVIACFYSCTKVINIDLNSKDPQVMIEGEVTDDSLTPQTVNITRSVNFSDENVFPRVTGASVKINDDAGNMAILAETSPGVYQDAVLRGIPGRTYYLTVIADGKTYTSICKMPQKVPFDTLVIKDRTGFGGGPGSSGEKSATPVFHDPIGQGNYYRFKLERNSTFSNSIFLFNDEVVDGGVNNRSINDGDLPLKANDTVKVKMMCIDKAVNLYFYSMRQNTNNSTATPANPVTNINGATLGYFSAHTVQTKIAIIQ